MERWVRIWQSRTASAIGLLAFLVFTGFWGFRAQSLPHDDDILKFLPQSSSEVQTFLEINKRFSATDIILVGIQRDDIFSIASLQKLESFSQALKADPRLSAVISLSLVNDFQPDPLVGGIVAKPLIPKLPQNAQESQALRKRILGNLNIAGNLVSKDGSAAMVYAYLSDGAEAKTIAAAVESLALQHFKASELYFDGAPFVSNYIFGVTQSDLDRLVPTAVLVIVVVMLLFFRSIVGAIWVLVSASAGLVWTLGVMNLSGTPLNLVLSSMPLVLLAVGSAYGIHLMSRYRAALENRDAMDAMAYAFSQAGSLVWASAVTTAASLSSFFVMDIGPLKSFGIYCAFGVICMTVSVFWLFPMVTSLGLNRLRPQSSTWLGAFTGPLLALFQNRRSVALAILVLLLLVSGAGLGRIDSTVDQAAFFNEGTPPSLAAAFSREKFGGNSFIQIQFSGDMNSPAALRKIQALSDRLKTLDGVSAVQDLPSILATFNEAMVGQLRVPDSVAQVEALYAFVEAEPFAAQLLSRDRQFSLSHIRIDAKNGRRARDILESTEAVAADVWRKGGVIQNVIWRIQNILSEKNIDALALKKFLERYQENSEQVLRLRSENLRAFLVSSENPVPIEASLVEEIAAESIHWGAELSDEVLALQTFSKLKRLQMSELDREDLSFSISNAWSSLHRDAKRQVQAQSLVEAMKLKDVNVSELQNVAWALWDMDDVFEGELQRELELEVSGLPAMYRGMQESVLKNQWRSMLCALGVVALILAIFFRSLAAGLLASLPTLCTLICVYGAMGWLGIHLDIGTSMLASLILGIGVDYAVHLLAEWKTPTEHALGDAAHRAGFEAGPGIVISALALSLGFFVLTLGEARPLQNVGGLTAAAMLIASLSSFWLVGALAQRTNYRRRSE